MTKTARRILLVIFFILFLISSSFLILYSLGLRIDFKNFNLISVGGVYIRSYPSSANIFLDNKPVKRNFSLFDKGVLISNLFPKKYLLEIKANNYLPYSRHIEVKPSYVTEVKNAVLIPINFKTLLEKEIKEFFILPDNKFLIINPQDEIFIENEKISEGKILALNNDLKKIILKSPKNDLLLLDAEKATTTKLKLINFEGINFSEDNAGELIFWQGKKINLFDLGKNKIILTATSSNQIIKAFASKLWIVWSEFDQKNNFSYLNILPRTSLAKPIQVIFPFKNKDILLKNGNVFVLEEDGSLYKYELVSNTQNKIATDVLNFYLSEDMVMLAAQEKEALEIFNLKDKTDYFRFNFPESKDLKKISWFKDNRHIFLHYKDNIQFLELEDLFKENIKIIAKTNYGVYDSKKNIFYFILDNQLNYIEFPQN